MAKNIYIVILFIVGLQLDSFGQSGGYLLKAGFLEKFANYAQWPKHTDRKSFKITVIGNNPFSNDLDIMYKGFEIKNRPVEINYIQSIYEIGNCDILFIAVREKDRLIAILSEIKNRPILTVSDFDGFGQIGVMINFYETQQGTIHFEINVNMLKKANIKMDVMLLDFAKIVQISP